MPNSPLVISVVGLQNSGKTTLVSKLCAEFTSQGLRAAVIKHDGHADQGAPIDWEKPGSDTTKYADAGAAYTMVTGGGQSLLRMTQDPDVGDVVGLMGRIVEIAKTQGSPLDVVIVEGYKRSDLPKLVPMHRASDVEWLEHAALTNLRAVVCSSDVWALAEGKWPVYHEDNIEELCYDLRR